MICYLKHLTWLVISKEILEGVLFRPKWLKFYVMISLKINFNMFGILHSMIYLHYASQFLQLFYSMM